MTDNVSLATDERGVCTLTLNRPEVHNAFDSDLIENLAIQLQFALDDDSIRVIIITGAGKSFSSGADINWMRSMIESDHQQNSMDAMKLAKLLHMLYTAPKPTIAKVNGSAYGGALGIIACCDIAVANREATFAFTEVRLGIVPAVVSPYVVNAIGFRNARRLFLTAEHFTSEQAQQMNLLHKLTAPESLEDEVEHEIHLLLQAGPSAQQECKRLIQKLAGISDDIAEYTAELIAQIRISEEGQEGLAAFLDKRKPHWLSD